MLKSYFKTAWRNLFKNKISSAINIGGLSVGLATGIIILLVVENELSYDRFNKNLAHIYLLMKNQKQVDGISTGDATAGPMAPAMKNEMPEVKYASRVAYFDNQVLRVGDKTVYGSGVFAEPDLFNMMTFPAVEGNPVQALQDAKSVVITEETASRLFGTVDAMGKVIAFNNQDIFKVAAVIQNIPSNSSVRFDMAFPFSYYARQNEWLNKWDDNRINTWVQLKALADVSSLNSRLTHLLQVRSEDKTVSLFLYPLSALRLHRSFANGVPSGGKIAMVYLLMALGVFVLLLACINFMNIATARSEHRSREVGVRKVLGASRKTIVYQFLSEALLMTFLALLLAMIMTKSILPAFNRFTGNNLVYDLSDWRIILSLVSTGILTGLVAGSYPAFFLSRFNTIIVIKGTGVTGRSNPALRRVLVTVQFVISIFFIVGTIVIYKQINYVRNRPLGYEQENMIDISANGALGKMYPVFKNELANIPGVVSATAGSDNVLQFGGSVTGMDYPGKVPGQEISVIVSSVAYDWTKTVGIRMKEGRDFSTSFPTDSGACLINEATVRKMGLKEPVIGARIGSSTVIGVFNDFVYNNPSGIIAPMMISLQTSDLPHILVRIRNDDHWRQTIAAIEAAAKKVNPDYPFDYAFSAALYKERFEEWSSVGTAAAVFGGMAIFIACLGLFGLSTFVAERRSREMSIRKVFGADIGNIWMLLSKDFLKPVFIAMLIVIPVSVWLAHAFLSNITYHTEVTWWMFVLAALITLVLALLTVSAQGIRTALMNPVRNLRNE